MVGSAVTALSLRGCVVCCGGSDGTISLYNWLAGWTSEFGQAVQGAVTSLACSADLSMTKGGVIAGTATGAVMRRTRGLLFGFNDATLFSNSSAIDTPILESLWSLASSAQDKRRAAAAAAAPVHAMALAAPFLVFATGPLVVVLNEERDSLVARLDVGGADAGPALISLSDEALYVCVGASVLECTRDWSRVPLRVMRRFELGHAVRAVASPCPAGLLVALVHRSLVLLDRANGMAFVDAIEVGEDVSLVAGTADCGPAATLAKSGLPSFSPSLLPFNPLQAVHLASRDALLALRPALGPEAAVVAARIGDFATAVRLLKAGKRTAAMMEVAEAHAEHLWAQGQRAAAVSTYAEYILPVAPAAYWREFTERLDALGEVALLEPYLPFNNRRLLPSYFYTRVLAGYIQRGDHEGLYARIARWPVFYEPEEIIARIAAALALEPQHAHEPQPAQQPLPNSPQRSTPFKFMNKGKLVLRTQSGDGSGISTGAGGARFLSLALVKLHEYTGEYIKAVEVLVGLGDVASLDYMDSHGLWTHFSLSHMVNDVLREALGTQLDVLGVNFGSSVAADDDEQHGAQKSYDGDSNNRKNRDKEEEEEEDDGDDNDDEDKEEDSNRLEKRRSLLLSLVSMSPKRVLRQLVLHVDDAPLRDIVKLLQPHPVLQIAYLETFRLSHPEKIDAYDRLIQEKRKAMGSKDRAQVDAILGGRE